MHQHCPRDVGISTTRAEPRLHRLEVPVRQFIPDKAPRRVRVRIQPHAGRTLGLCPSAAGTGTHRTERRVGFGNRHVQSIENPPIGDRQRLSWNCVQRLHRFSANFRQQKPSDVPQLRKKVAARRKALFQVGRIEQHIHAQPHPGDHRPSQSISAVQLHHVHRIDAVAKRLRHLHMIHVAHRAVQIHGVVRRLAHEMQARHDHARDPEEQDLGRRNQHIAGIKCLEIR